ncbi:hypothetical protein ACFSQ7_06900 [Paenibacillus rhizoplanae]
MFFSAGAEPGEYSGKSATRVIRRMQTSIVKSFFEDQISQYSKKSIYTIKFLNYYTTQLHGIIVNRKRYSSFNNLDPVVQEEFEQKTRNIREEFRRNLRTAQYLLESNLAIQHQDNNSECKKMNLKIFLAFADWLVVLQDNADTCHFTDFDVLIQIDDEYKVDNIFF